MAGAERTECNTTRACRYWTFGPVDAGSPCPVGSKLVDLATVGLPGEAPDTRGKDFLPSVRLEI